MNDKGLCRTSPATPGLLNIYKKGLALMVISPKNWNFGPYLCPHWGLFNYIQSILMISSEPIGRKKS